MWKYGPTYFTDLSRPEMSDSYMSKHRSENRMLENEKMKKKKKLGGGGG